MSALICERRVRGRTVPLHQQYERWILWTLNLDFFVHDAV